MKRLTFILLASMLLYGCSDTLPKAPELPKIPKFSMPELPKMPKLSLPAGQNLNYRQLKSINPQFCKDQS